MHKLMMIISMIAPMLTAGTITFENVNVDEAITVTGSQSNTIATALQSQSLAQAFVDGDFAGTETIGPLRVDAKMFGFEAGDESTGTGWGAYGYQAGSFASGDNWGAYGRAAGESASGESWGAYGFNAGNSAIGNFWGAYGYQAGFGASGLGWGAYGFSAGTGATWTNSHAFGRYAGRSATGNNRLYIDVYGADPTANGGTNDMIFGDNGKLHLGRTGTLTNSEPNELRGEWVSTDNLSGQTPTLDAHFATKGYVDNLEPVTSDYASTNQVLENWRGSASNFASLAVTNEATIYFIWE